MATPAAQNKVRALKPTPVYNFEGKRRRWRLIREERQKNVEFWIKVLGPVIAALTGLAGAIIGVLSFLNK